MEKKPVISFVVAHGRNREIGNNSGLLWDLPSDLRRFREVTIGHPIVMGRKTFDAIGRVLPGRLNIIVSRRPDLVVEGATVVHSIDDAIEVATKADTEEICIIGGGEIFSQTLNMADRIYLTVIDHEFPQADVFFPEYPEFGPKGPRMVGEENGLAWEYQVWERKS